MASSNQSDIMSRFCISITRSRVFEVIVSIITSRFSPVPAPEKKKGFRYVIYSWFSVFFRYLAFVRFGIDSVCIVNL